MHYLLVYAYDVNILCKILNTIRKNTYALLKANREVSLEVNTQKTKYVVMSCHQNAGQNHSILIANKSFEDVQEFKY
jgi:hypothetical protein